jgi:hypothetical protein
VPAPLEVEDWSEVRCRGAKSPLSCAHAVRESVWSEMRSPGGWERAVQSLLLAFRTQRLARTRAVPKLVLFKPSRLGFFVPYSMPVVDQVL